MKYQKFDEDSYNVHIIKDSRFKNCQMEIIFRNKVDRQHITKRSMLIDLMSYYAKKYPKPKDLSLALENLYNSDFYGVNSKVGGIFITSFCFEFLNPKYTPQCTLKDFITFPLDIIQNPNIINGEFEKDGFNIIKERLTNELLSIKDNPKKYAINKALEIYAPNMPIGMQVSGYLDELENLTPKDIADYYEYMLEHDYCDIFVIGDLNSKEILKIINQSLHIRSIKTDILEMNSEIDSRKKVLEQKMAENYPQTNLVVVYNIDHMSKFEKDIVLPIFNTIYGSGSLETKLAKYLRGEKSLCYNVTSYHFKYDHTLLIHTGISQKNYDLAIKLIKKATREMKKGIISDLELSNAIKSYQNSIDTLLDSQNGIVNNYLFNYIDNQPFYEERKKMVQKVTVEDLVKLARKLRLNIISLVKGEEE